MAKIKVAPQEPAAQAGPPAAAVAPSLEQAAIQRVVDLLDAHYSLLYIVSSEEPRVEASLQKAGDRARIKRSVTPWSLSRGFVRPWPLESPGTSEVGDSSGGAASPVEALRKIEEAANEGLATLFVLRDFDAFMDDPEVRRLMRDLATRLHESECAIVVLSATLKVPPDLDKDLTVIDWPLPDGPVIARLAAIVASQAPSGQQRAMQEAARSPELIEACRGLTFVEIGNVLTSCAVTDGVLSIGRILDEKRNIVRKSGILDIEASKTPIETVGGLDVFKKWIGDRRRAFGPEAHAFGIKTPRGVLIVGPPGGGKSLSARATASLWNMPLLSLDMGRLFGGVLGETEGHMRRAIQLAESTAPCILFVDEMEKGFSNAMGGGDAGTAARTFGTFLKWMSDHQAPVFVVATANDITALRPELLRKGRFDEIFFVDLPNSIERQAIFEVHLRLRGRDPAQFDLAQLANSTPGFAGSEIEAAIDAGLHAAFIENARPLTTNDVLKACSETYPISKTMADQINALRAWANGRARKASSNPVGAKVAGRSAALQDAPSGPEGDDLATDLATDDNPDGPN